MVLICVGWQISKLFLGAPGGEFARNGNSVERQGKGLL